MREISISVDWTVIGIVGAAALISLLILLVVYNSLVARRFKVKESFSGIYVQLKRRADLIPNIVSSVKGYAKHERETLERLTQLRASFLGVDSNNHSAVMEQGNLLAQALKTVF